MRFRDLVGLALFALSRHKVRTLLTMLGVLFGTNVLIVSLAVRRGVQDTIVREVSKYTELRRIEVHPQPGKAVEEPEPIKGKMSDERRERLAKEVHSRLGRGGNAPPEKRLTQAQLEEFAALPHVTHAEPVVQQQGRAVLGDRSDYASFLAIPNEARAVLSNRLLAGEMLRERDPQGVLVSEFLLYQLGVVDDYAVARTVGQTLTFTVRLGGRPQASFLLRLLTGSSDPVSVTEETLLDKVVKRLPDSVDRLGLTPREEKALRRLLSLRPKKPVKVEEIRATFTIRGVLRSATEEEMRRRGGWVWRHTDLLLAPDAATAFSLRLPQTREYGFYQAIIEVDDKANVKSVQQEIRDMGFNANSAIEFIEQQEFTYLIGISAMSVVAVIALIVAAIGITNTMLMSVLERVREIGVMKALGARDSQILLLFLMEGALIGLVGGLLGMALAWGTSFPADAWLRASVTRQLTIKLEGSLFAFPWWLVVGGPVFAVLVTTLAALYPARRAVRIDPVQALRHE